MNFKNNLLVAIAFIGVFIGIGLIIFGNYLIHMQFALYYIFFALGIFITFLSATNIILLIDNYVLIKTNPNLLPVNTVVYDSYGVSWTRTTNGWINEKGESRKSFKKSDIYEYAKLP